MLTVMSKERVKKTELKFLMAFAINRRNSPPPTGTNFHQFLPRFFSFAIESYLYETDFTPGPSQNYHF